MTTYSCAVMVVIIMVSFSGLAQLRTEKKNDFFYNPTLVNTL